MEILSNAHPPIYSVDPYQSRHSERSWTGTLSQRQRLLRLCRSDPNFYPERCDHLLVQLKTKQFKGRRAVKAAEQDVSFFLNIFVIAGQLFILYYVHVEIEEYRQQTVDDTRIKTGQPSLPSLRPLNTANRTSDTCRETPSADFDSMAMADQISSAIVKAQDIQFSSLSNEICDGLKQFSSNFVNIFNAKYGDKPPPKRARIDVHSDGSSIGRETQTKVLLFLYYRQVCGCTSDFPGQPK